MGYLLETTDNDCYPNSTVLINKLGITDEQALKDNELLENEPVKGLIVEKLVNNAVKHVYGTANDYEIDSFYQFLRKLICVARLELDRLTGWIVSGARKLRPRICAGLVFE